MGNWAYALSKGVESAAGAASGLLDEDRKIQQQIAAEERAADTKLKTEERLVAIREAAQQRAGERFAKRAQGRMNEDVPQEAAPVTKLTAAGAQQAGFEDGIQTDKPNDMIQKLQAILSSPTATDEQKENAQGMLEQMGKQVTGEKAVNAKAVEGQTRKRTYDEASRMALQDSMLAGDFTAAKEAKGLLYDKDDIAEKRLAFEEKKLDQRDRKDQLDREQRDLASQRQYEATIARIEKAASKTDDPYKFITEIGKEVRSNRSQINTLRREKIAATKGDDPDLAKEIQAQIDDIVANNKKLSRGALEYARDSGIKVPSDLLEDQKEEPKSEPKALSTLPPGAKKVGTSGGKDVYEVNGKRFIAQ